MASDRLTLKRQRFVEEYLTEANATQAAVRAGYSKRNADKIGPQLLREPVVAAAIAAAQAKRAERLEVCADEVLRHWWAIANADPNDIVQFRRVACRHCHGAEHAFQWIDESEFAHALAAHLSATSAGGVIDLTGSPTDAGGYGYSKQADPVATCPKCFGEGQGEVFIADTRKLTGDAKLLYAGMKVTQSGFEVKLHDQMKALDNVARHLGMFVDKVEHTVVDRAGLLAAARDRAERKVR